MEWEHTTMYSAFMLSGMVDLVGFYAPSGTLPPGTEQVATIMSGRRMACCDFAHVPVWRLELMRTH